MSMKQVQRDFEELYPGKNQSGLLEDYYKQKKKEGCIVFFALIFLFFLVLYSDYRSLRLNHENSLERSTNNQKKQEILLEVKRGEKSWEKIKLLLFAKEYTEEELENYYEELIAILPEHCLGENLSVDEISFPLSFPVEIEGYPFSLMWTSYNRDKISSMGEIFPDRKENTPVEIGVIISYQEWEREYRFVATVLKEDISRELLLLTEQIEEEEEKTRKKENLFLPKYFLGEELRWKYQGKNRAGYLFVFILPALYLLWIQKDRELRKKVEKKRERLRREYPDFVNRLVLYIGVGISIKESIFQIHRQMERKRKEEEGALYEELHYIVIQMKNGLSEKQAYEILGRRCQVSEYRKLTALLTRYLEKGSREILEQLTAEAEKSREEQFKQIRKAGEEMGTRLLFPMMLLLGLIMVLIMIPAMYSFQI